MKKLLFPFIFASLLVGASCSDDDPVTSSFDFEEDELFISNDGGVASQYVAVSGISNVTFTDDLPSGWSIAYENNRVSVSALATASERTVQITFSGASATGTTISDDFSVSMVDFVDLSAEGLQSNTIIATKANTVYQINPFLRGEESVEQTYNVVGDTIVWRTSNLPISSVHLQDGQLLVHTAFDEEDLDGDGQTQDLIEGNALVAALDSNNEVLWSWHIWVRNSEPGSVVSASGIEFMDCNLGAFANDNSSQDAILSSYGMYYQWGRKDPFIYPSTYNASGGVDAALYGESGYGSYISYLLPTDEEPAVLHSVEESVQNPRTFYAGLKAWSSDSSGSLWSASTSGEKSIYDPSPRGWRLPTVADFETLSVDAGQSSVNGESYGANLSGLLFMGLGNKRYLTGITQNIGTDYSPWEGNYWTSAAGENSEQAQSMRFYFDSESGTASQSPSLIVLGNRATAMQIRAVKQ